MKMRKLLTALFCALLMFPVLAIAQQTATSGAESTDEAAPKKRPPVFRANKGQITKAQETLKQKGHYTGEITGKLDDDTRAALKKYQDAEGLKVTGTLNRDTLVKMGIPVDAPPAAKDDAPSAPASSAEEKEKKPRAPIFRANKEQIMQAQEILKQRGFYAGEVQEKLTDDVRAGLKKYQDAEGIKVTGTLNAITLEKMKIPLTDKQKETVEKQKAMTMMKSDSN